MPTPTPTNQEDHDQFMSRCMADEMMKQDMADPAEREAACEMHWDKGKSGAKSEQHYQNLMGLVRDTPWAILPERLAIILDLMNFRAQGGRLTTEQITERVGAARPAISQRAGAIAVLPLFGLISQRMNMMTATSGGTSTEMFGKQFSQAMADPQVGAIVIDVDSPGGTVQGVDELADQIFAARGRKPVVAVANSLAASAAYWIATAADEIVVTPSGEVGSIGVMAAHQDQSKCDEAMGVKTTLISAGKFKTEGNPFEPLTAEARDYTQARVNDYYQMFVKAVARDRGVGIDAVRNGFGEGRVVGAKQALSLGMADRIGTLDETLARMARELKQPGGVGLSRESRERRLRSLT